MRHYLFSALAFAAFAGRATALKYGYNQVPIGKDPEEVAAAFPKPENVELLSPAFLKPESVPGTFSEGADGPTDDGELDYFLRDLSSRHSWMTYRVADFQSEEGRSFPYVYLSNTADGFNATSGASNDKKLRVWLQGGVHGNEPAGDQSLLAFLGKMDAEPEWAASLLEKMDLLVLPRYNPDGVFYFQRYLATNFDPNRDHMKLARRQTRDIKRLFSDFAPHVAADMHEFTGTTRRGANKDLTIAADALFSAAKNLNIDPEIRRLSEELFAKRMGEDQVAAGFRWSPYVTHGTGKTPDEVVLDEAGSDAKIGRNAMGLTQSITILCETRGIGLADQHFERRTASALQMVLSIVQTAADNAETVYETIESGRERFIESNDDIVVTDYPELRDIEFPLINTTNGDILQYPIKFTSTTPTTANLTRSRPEAYLIPRAWADLVERLRVYGVEVTELPYGYTGPVEALTVTSVAFEDSYYEGVIRTTVTTQPVRKEEVKLPPGSYWVSTRQKNAALAFVALEPENIDSYVSFNIIPLAEGDEYPIFRIVP
ncbi:hypothetical protein VTO42DRAFT_5748 [Malbranchea cinnamomea]